MLLVCAAPRSCQNDEHVTMMMVGGLRGGWAGSSPSSVKNPAGRFVLSVEEASSSSERAREITNNK